MHSSCVSINIHIYNIAMATVHLEIRGRSSRRSSGSYPKDMAGIQAARPPKRTKLLHPMPMQTPGGHESSQGPNLLSRTPRSRAHAPSRLFPGHTIPPSDEVPARRVFAIPNQYIHIYRYIYIYSFDISICKYIHIYIIYVCIARVSA